MVSLNNAGSYLEGTIPIRVDTTNFVEGDVVFVTTGYDMELNGAGDTVSVIVNNDKERWYSGDDSTGEINLIAYPDSFDNLDTYEGELVLNILSGHQKKLEKYHQIFRNAEIWWYFICEGEKKIKRRSI
jgi:hypothetical protein